MRYAFRRRAFADWKARNGTTEVPFFVETRIDTATRHHKNALLCEWLVRTTENLTADTMQSLIDKASDFTERRDRALRDIGLSADPAASDSSAIDRVLAEARRCPPKPIAPAPEPPTTEGPADA